MKAALLLALSSLPRSPAFLQGLFLPSRTTTCCWSPLALHTRRAASRSVPIAMDGTDREGYREGYRGTPTTLDSSQWREGNKAGFSVVADFGTADDVVVPPGASEQGKGSVLVNGRKGRVDSLVEIGIDHVTVQARTESSFKAPGDAPFHIDVVYEDDVMAVVHKPPGVCTHPPRGGEVPQTQAQSLMSMRCCVPYHVKCAPAGRALEGILWRPMLVHRLDKDTEGLQLVAKTKGAYVELQRQFAKRLIKKTYAALVEGCVPQEQGCIDLDVDHKHAVSDWKVVARYRSAALGETHMTMLHFFPRHGRKHQIRIHCADGLGCSIVGDPRHRGTLVGQGLFLCAIGLDFTHPTTGEPLSLSLPYPPRFVSFPSSQHQMWETAHKDASLMKELAQQAKDVHLRLTERSRGELGDDSSDDDVKVEH